MEITAEKEFDYYTKVINKAMEGLNPAERGIYQYMRSQNPDPTKWEFNLEYMATILNVTYYQIRKLVKQLISKGLVERIQKRVHGFIKYEYKVRNKKGEVRDDAKLMKRRPQSEEPVKEKVITEVIETVETPSIKVEKKEKIEKKEWRALFDGKERFIEKFISDRKKWLSNCDHYKKLGRSPSDLEVENHINRKLNDENSDMEARINEFILNELRKGEIKIERESSQEISDVRKLEIEKKDKILMAKTNLSKERFPEHWGKPRELGDREWLLERKRLEATIKLELDAIEEKYNQEYKTLLEVARR